MFQFSTHSISPFGTCFKFNVKPSKSLFFQFWNSDSYPIRIIRKAQWSCWYRVGYLKIFFLFSGNKNLRWLNGPYFIIILQKTWIWIRKKLEFRPRRKFSRIFGRLKKFRTSFEGARRGREEVKKTNSREWMRVSDGWAKDGRKDAKKVKM